MGLRKNEHERVQGRKEAESTRSSIFRVISGISVCRADTRMIDRDRFQSVPDTKSSSENLPIRQKLQPRPSLVFDGFARGRKPGEIVSRSFPPRTERKDVSGKGCDEIGGWNRSRLPADRRRTIGACLRVDLSKYLESCLAPVTPRKTRD